MNKFSVILEPLPDGSIRLPLPPELLGSKVFVEVSPAVPSTDGGELKFGCLKGKIKLAPDFDEPLDDFQEYM